MSLANKIDDTIEYIEQLVRNSDPIDLERVNIDVRSGSMYKDEDNEFLIVHCICDRNFLYYSGFSCIDQGKYMQIGDYLVFPRECDERVEGVFEILEGKMDDE